MPNPKLTPEITAKIAEYYRSTGLFCDACVYAGVGKRTGLNWRRLGQTALSGKYYDFEQAIAAASAEMMAPVVNQLKTRATGGVIRVPKKKRYQDNHGVWRETNQVVLDENGRPEYELVVVDPDPKVAMFLAERLRRDEFGEQTKLTVVDDAARDVISVAMARRVGEWKKHVETTAKAIEDHTEGKNDDRNDAENA